MIIMCDCKLWYFIVTFFLGVFSYIGFAFLLLRWERNRRIDLTRKK